MTQKDLLEKAEKEEWISCVGETEDEINIEVAHESRWVAVIDRQGLAAEEYAELIAQVPEMLRLLREAQNVVRMASLIDKSDVCNEMDEKLTKFLTQEDKDL